MAFKFEVDPNMSYDFGTDPNTKIIQFFEARVITLKFKLNKINQWIKEVKSFIENYKKENSAIEVNYKIKLGNAINSPTACINLRMSIISMDEHAIITFCDLVQDFIEEDSNGFKFDIDFWEHLPQRGLDNEHLKIYSDCYLNINNKW